ncbi:MAG: hypothetical protein ACOCRX_07800, partial [Candidatus Woesearchaeota archaeon]
YLYSKLILGQERSKYNMPTHFWKGLGRILINLFVRGKFTTRMHDIFMDKDDKEGENSDK